MGNYRVNLSVLHSLCALYEETGEPRYLQLAEQIVQREFPRTATFNNERGNDYVRDALAGKDYYQFAEPRWECLHTVQGLAALYRLTGKQDYREAFERIWWSIVEHDRHNTGGFGSAESAQGSPYHAGAIETCGTTAWTALCVDMLRLTGNPVIADELEFTVMNAVLGSHSRSGRWSTYNTPMDGQRVANTIELAWQHERVKPSHQLNCCSMHAPRGLGTINDWALMADGRTIVLNWYGPCTMKVAIEGVSLTLRQETDYPRTGRILLHVTVSERVRFPLKLRVPYWSEKTQIHFNEDAIEDIVPGHYVVIDRQWQGDDTVEINLDMSLRYWVDQQRCQGKASIFRGPVLLAYDTKTPLIEHIPTLDAQNMQGCLLEAEVDSNAIVVMELENVDGGKVLLTDFDRAGANGTCYVSWLKVLNVQSTPFTRRNPLRSGRAVTSSGGSFDKSTPSPRGSPRTSSIPCLAETGQSERAEPSAGRR